MRIIAGEFRHRALITPPDAETTRPIPDRVKESLFSLLRGRFEGAIVADLFAGTGAIGLETISRGAAACLFIERDKRIHDILTRNIAQFRCEDRASTVRADALGPEALTRVMRFANEHGGLDLLFLDPPYPLVEDKASFDRIRRQFERLLGLLKDDAFAVLRTPWPAVHTPRRPQHEAPRPTDVIDAPDEEELELAAQQHAGVQPVEDANLTFDAGEGPETHVYRAGAVHLYMRAHPAEPKADRRDHNPSPGGVDG